MIQTFLQDYVDFATRCGEWLATAERLRASGVPENVIDPEEFGDTEKHRFGMARAFASLGLIEDVRVFVYRTDPGEEEIPYDPETLLGDKKLDLPFRVCFFQTEGRAISVHPETGVQLIAIMVHERAPLSYEFYLLMRNKDGASDIRTLFVGDEGEEGMYDFMRFVSGRFVSEMKASLVASVKTPDRVRYRYQGQKIIKKVKNVVYVVPRPQACAAEHEHRNIEWSHAWEVRGHWRRIGGRTGKDREGNPANGFTWVRPYTKGRGELVRKIRIVGSKTEVPA